MRKDRMLLEPLRQAETVNSEIVNETKDILGDRFFELLDRFEKDTGAILSTIEFSRASNDYAGVRDAAHSLKSSSYQMGAMRMNRFAESIEDFLNEKNPLTTIQEETDLDAMIEHLRHAFTSYKDDIRRFL